MTSGDDSSDARDSLRAWSLDADEVTAALDVDPSRGLGSDAVRDRLARYGENQLLARKSRSAWSILFAQFASLVIGLLGVAAGLSFAFGKWLEGTAVLAVVCINAAIGFVTELRAVRSMEALRRLGVSTARVRRDERVVEVPASSLVPGDVVVLDAGDVVTADLRLLEASNLQADESTLTGESVPVSKNVEAVDEAVSVTDRSSMLFKGTSITRGSGVAVVVATGMSTELGRIATLVQGAEKAATPLERRLERLGRRLIWVTLSIAALTTLAGIARGRDVWLMVETGIALAVAAIPEGLPIVATLTLARGMWRLARHHALVNRLSAVETLGATGVILCDKTGTLTENRMTVTRLVLAEDDIAVSESRQGHVPAFVIDGRAVDPAAGDLREAIEIAVLCNNASLGAARRSAEPNGAQDTSVGDPMEVALLELGARAGILRDSLLERYPERREEAFDSRTRAMATFHESEGRYRVAVKGAVEAVFAACTHRLVQGEAIAFDDDARGRMAQIGPRLAGEGLRVLALAQKTTASLTEAPYEALTWVGFVALVDPPRMETREELERCRRAGLRVVMATGDHAATAASVARSLGLAADAEPVIGAELPDLAVLTEEDRRRLLDTPVFARVDPEHKLRLIELHQSAGAVVAMTGDGVNDAPALRKADIGVAMGHRGTQVAREAADMILQDDSFASIVHAVQQGRVIFANIRRFVVYLLSCNISEILIVFLATIVGGPLPILPLQVLYLNLVTDVFPALAVGLSEGEANVMNRPPRDPREPVLGRGQWIEIGSYGVLISASVLAAFVLALRGLGFGPDRAVTVSFLTLAFAQVWHVFDMRGPGTRLLRNDVTRSRYVWGAVGLCTMLLVAAVYVPVLARVLGTGHPGLEGWTLALVASFTPMVLVQSWRSLVTDRSRRGGPSAPPSPANG